MIHIETSQYIFAAVLLFASVVAFYTGTRVLILVLWANLILTMSFSYSPYALMMIDLLSAWTILMLVEDKTAKSIAVLFILMMFIYPLVGLLGFFWAYSIVEILAYGQLLFLGADGVGGFCSYCRDRLRRRLSHAIHIQESKLDAAPHDQVAVAKDPRPRVNAR